MLDRFQRCGAEHSGGRVRAERRAWVRKIAIMHHAFDDGMFSCSSRILYTKENGQLENEVLANG
jgi:hypothetical protein